MSLLEALFLDENQLRGTIPDCLGDLVKLRQLFLFKNQLTGQVPAQLSELVKLGTQLPWLVRFACCQTASDLYSS